MRWREHLRIDGERMDGTLCPRGTRIPVFVVLDNLAERDTVESLLANYPGRRAEHVPAAAAFESQLAHERVVPMPAWLFVRTHRTARDVACGAVPSQRFSAVRTSRIANFCWKSVNRGATPFTSSAHSIRMPSRAFM
jgi:uncharacterized protein (DUF433 family)